MALLRKNRDLVNLESENLESQFYFVTPLHTVTTACTPFPTFDIRRFILKSSCLGQVITQPMAYL
jgi:hypothetical protein